MVEIREATAANRDAIWDIFREVVAARDTYLSILECRAGTPWDIGSRPIHGLTLQKAADTFWAPIFCGLTNPAVARTLRTRRSWLLRLRVVEELVARWLNIV